MAAHQGSSVMLYILLRSDDGYGVYMVDISGFGVEAVQKLSILPQRCTRISFFVL